MKKILCLTDGFNQGGAERQLVGLAHLLTEKGYDVTLSSYQEKNFYKSLINNYNVKYELIKVKSNKLSKFWGVKTFIRNGKFDVVITYKGSPNVICGFLKLIGGRFKMIGSERCSIIKLSRNQKVRFFLYRFADYLVPNSFSQERFIKDRFPSLTSKTITITNFTDTKHFCPKRQATLNSIPYILVAGRISYQKNILRFIESLVKVKEDGFVFKVLWFGNINFGESDYYEQCIQMIKKYQFSDYFEFHPATDNILEEYHKCDVFCLPSIFEGYPNVICEAMSCGKPILCSNVCDNPIIVDNKRNGILFDPFSVDDMTKKIEEYFNLSDIIKDNMGNESRLLAEQRFSEEVFVSRYTKLIES